MLPDSFLISELYKLTVLNHNCSVFCRVWQLCTIICTQNVGSLMKFVCFVCAVCAGFKLSDTLQLLCSFSLFSTRSWEEHLQNDLHTPVLRPLCPRTTRVSWYQKGKSNLDFTEARVSERQWHQLGHMQVCTSLQTDNHASTPPLSSYRPDALPAAQPMASLHWRPKRPIWC